MSALLNTLTDFPGSNCLTAFIEGCILGYFVGWVSIAMLSCLFPPTAPGAPLPPGKWRPTNAIRALAGATNFTHGSTIVAGLLTAATDRSSGQTCRYHITTAVQAAAAQIPQPQTNSLKPAKPNVVQTIIQDPQREAFNSRKCAHGCMWNLARFSFSLMTLRGITLGRFLLLRGEKAASHPSNTRREQVAEN